MNNSPKDLIQSLRSYFGRSIRRRLILGITIVNLFIFTVFMLFIMDRQQSFLHAQSIEQANSLAHALAVNSTPWVISDDIQGLSELIASLTRYPELRYVMILSPQGKVLGHTRNENVGLYVNDPTSQRLMNAEPVPLQLVINRQIVDVAVPIQVNNILVGWSRVCLGQENIRAASENILRNGAIYVFIAMLPTFLIAYFMALGIGRGLHHLVTVADAIRKGARDVRVSLNRDDEIGRLGNDFNQMLNSIVSHEKAINLAHEELEKHKNHLEELVKERTKELGDSNNALEIAKEKAEAADRLKSAFLATMSHELRTPLNSIIGFTGIMLQGLAGPLNDEQTKQLGMVQSSARHLLNLINDILDISKIEAGQLEMASELFDMRTVIQKVMRTVTPLAEKKRLVLVSEVAPEVGQITSDQRRVEQILINLLNNAIKFTEHGEVRIESEVRGSWLMTRVIDTGIGVKPEGMDALFEPFRQVDAGLARQHEGTGLGLSICQKLVEMLGGAIWAESEWGVGSTFTFTLPVQISDCDLAIVIRHSKIDI